MKRFLSYLLEEIKYGTLQHVLSGKLTDSGGVAPDYKDGMEHSYHALIPSKNTKSGTTNFWASKLTHGNGTTHEFHFGINDDIDADTFKQKHAQLSRQGRDSVAPHQVFYSFSGTEEAQKRLLHHGPETMHHVAHHFTNLFREIPKGHRVVLDSGIDEDSAKKLRVYRMMAERSMVRTGLARFISKPEDSKVVLERI